LTEVFTHEFSMVAPRGVTMMLASGTLWQMSGADPKKNFGFPDEDVEASLNAHLAAAAEMGKHGASIVCLGCVPLNLARGFDRIGELIRETEAAAGVPVFTSVTSQINALRHVGARRVGQIHIPSPVPVLPPENDYLRISGFEVVAESGLGATVPTVATFSSYENVRLARSMLNEHPEIDTLYFPGPHRATLDAIEAMENEFGLNVVTAAQAIFWEGFRRAGIAEPIGGFGRLLREPWNGQAHW
jgi:maleate cis-trans isomerase